VSDQRYEELRAIVLQNVEPERRSNWDHKAVLTLAQCHAEDSESMDRNDERDRRDGREVQKLAAQLAATHAAPLEPLVAANLNTWLKEECERQHARAGEAEAQMAATHAAIRALPRYSLNRLDPSMMGRTPSEHGEWVEFEALARLLGDPAQQTKHEDLESRVDKGVNRPGLDLPRRSIGDKS